MFELEIRSDYEPLFEFLKRESTMATPSAFCFSTREKAASTLSQFVLYYLIDQKLDEFVRCEYIKKEEKKELSLFYPSYDVKKFLEPIAAELLFHFRRHCQFHLFGFMQFGIKEVQKELYNILYASLYDFYDHKKNFASVSWIEDYFQKQPSSFEELLLVIDSNGDAVLLDKGKALFRESYDKHYSIIGHIIDEKPRSLKVSDPSQLLQKEFVIILKKLFRSKVEFTDEASTQNSHPER